MSALVCNKCSTSINEGADKCSNCGFPFSNNKMSTVGKYLGEFAPKPTILDAKVSGAIYQKPALKSEEPFSLENNLPLFKNQDFVNANQNENDIEDSTKLNIRDIHVDEHLFPNELPQTLETERITRDTIGTQEDSIPTNENNCTKCGYILSDFSTECPSCGHNNIKSSATMRMPITPESTDFSTNIFGRTINEQNPIHETGAFPHVTRQKDPAKTISEHQDHNNRSAEEFANPNQTQRHEQSLKNNNTIREGYNSFDDDKNQEGMENRHNNNQEPLGTVRLEAIYLGQDSDQKMIINIPKHSSQLDITRGIVDEGDNTISSDTHATIYKEGEDWKIENKASNKAVFIQVNDVSTIKNGDIIMLGGDKFYVFVDESNK